MNRRKILLLIACGILLFSVSCAGINVPPQFIEKINLDAIVNVRSTNRAGSGFLIGYDNYHSYVLTAQHLIDNSSQKKFLINNGRYFYEAELINSLPWRDVALLKIKNKKLEPKIVFLNKLPPFEKTLYRLSRDYFGNFDSDKGTMGSCDILTPTSILVTICYFNDGAKKGNSGSAVINEDGMIVGHIIGWIEKRAVFAPLFWNELVEFFPELRNIK